MTGSGEDQPTPVDQVVAADPTGVASGDGGWTVEDLARLPDDGKSYEIIDGSLHVTPQPDDQHQSEAEEIRAALRSSAPPGWQVTGAAGLRLPNGFVAPDVVVLRPGAPPDQPAQDATEVALVVEVESPGSRRYDRYIKPGLYAEAGIESYWRVERTANGPIAHLYTRAEGGHYGFHRSVHPGQVITAELPYAVQVAPATWH